MSQPTRARAAAAAAACAILASLAAAAAAESVRLTARDSGAYTLRLRISRQYDWVTDWCDRNGNCPVARESEAWSVVISPAGVDVESELESLGWDVPRVDDWEKACTVNGRFNGKKYQITHFNWMTPREAYAQGYDEFEPGVWRGPDRVFRIRINTAFPEPARGATAWGDCPPERDGQRLFDMMIESLEETTLDEIFVPQNGSSRRMQSTPNIDGARFALEVLEGDLDDLERHTTLLRYLESLIPR